MGAIVNLNAGTGQNLDAVLRAGEPYKDRDGDSRLVRRLAPALYHGVLLSGGVMNTCAARATAARTSVLNACPPVSKFAAT